LVDKLGIEVKNLREMQKLKNKVLIRMRLIIRNMFMDSEEDYRTSNIMLSIMKNMKKDLYLFLNFIIQNI